MAPAPHLFAARPDQLDLAVEIDDDAATLYADHGLDLHFAADHPFVAAERVWWTAAIAAGRLIFAADAAAPTVPLAFAAFGFLDGEPYLDQLSVRRHAMRRGLGRALLAHVAAWSAGHASRALWLTTYAHLPFNRPYYESAGFAAVAPPHRPEMAATLADQRDHLPRPDDRVVMRLGLATSRRRPDSA
jgi:GNAT superfamily N-acetyltransferase